MAPLLNKEGFFTETAEQELSNQTEDMQIESLNDFTKEEVDSLLSEGKDDYEEDEIPSAQVQKQKPRINDDKSFKEPKEIPSTSGHQHKGSGRKRHREDESAKTKRDTGVKRSRQEKELNSIQERINSSSNSIGFLKTT